jgi:hypothetical protein
MINQSHSKARKCEHNTSAKFLLLPPPLARFPKQQLLVGFILHINLPNLALGTGDHLQYVAGKGFNQTATAAAQKF